MSDRSKILFEGSLTIQTFFMLLFSSDSGPLREE